MENEKRKSGFSILVKAAAGCAAVHVGMIALGKYVAKKSRTMELANAGKKEKNYLAFMNGKDIKLGKERVEKVSIQSYMGAVVLDMTEADIIRDVDMDIKCVMGAVNIKVPPMVRVVLDGSNTMSGFANKVPEYEVEDIPTVYIYAESVMGGICVQMVP